MAKSLSKRTPEWREFEQLVVRIEKTLVPRGAIVRSPDRLRSLLTNRLREVDASIRTKIGTAEITVTIECRKRRATQDVTWLEQLASKKQALGVARTIAVSASNFSADAVKAAEYYGIDLRVVRGITTEDIESWPLPASIVHMYKHSELLEPPNVEFVMLPGETADSFLDRNDQSESSKKNISAPLFFRPSIGDHISLNEIWNMAERQMEIYSKLKRCGQAAKVDLTIEVPGDLKVHTTLGLRDVKRIHLRCMVSWKQEILPLSDAKLVEYANASDSTTPTIARADFETKEATNNLRIGLQTEEGSDELRFSVELAIGVKNEG